MHLVNNLSLFMVCMLLPKVLSNSPPEFVLDDNVRGGDIVVRLREGPNTPIGSTIYRAKAFDADGDPLTFGVIYPGQNRRSDSGVNNNDLAEIVNEPNSNEANLVLKKLLDAEEKREHQLVLTLTDNRLGNGNFMTQSLLIIVEDINDNIPSFEVYTLHLAAKSYYFRLLNLVSRVPK